MLAAGLSIPSLAFAEVNIDGTVINQGENTVGGGTATLADTVLDTVNVMANNMAITDEELTVNFNSGNDIEELDIGGSSNVEVSFTGDGADPFAPLAICIVSAAAAYFASRRRRTA